MSISNRDWKERIDNPQCGGSCNGCYYCPDLHPVEMQPVSAAPPVAEYQYAHAVDLAETLPLWLTETNEAMFQKGVAAGRRQILAEQAANRQILAAHWRKCSTTTSRAT